MLEKPIIIRLCIIGGISILLSVAILVFPGIEKEMDDGTLTLILFTGAYVIIALILVYKLAPKRFRVK